MLIIAQIFVVLRSECADTAALTRLLARTCQLRDLCAYLVAFGVWQQTVATLSLAVFPPPLKPGFPTAYPSSNLSNPQSRRPRQTTIARHGPGMLLIHLLISQCGRL